MEKDFDKIIKDILSNPPEFEPTASDLNLMRAMLSGKSSGRAWLWLLALLFMPMLLGGYFLFDKIEGLSARVAALETEKTMTLESQKVQIVDSTIHKTVYVYDTVYRKFYKDIYIENKVHKAQNLTTNQLTSTQNPSVVSVSDWQQMAAILQEVALQNGWAKKDENGQFIPLNDALAGIPFFQKNKSKGENAFENQAKSTRNSFFDQKPMGAAPFGEVLPPSGVTAINSSWKFDKNTISIGKIPAAKKANPLLYTIPRGLSVGIEGSPLSFTPISGSSKNYAYEYGLSADVHFAKNVRLESGVFLSHSKVYAKEALLFDQFPTGEPDAPGHTLKELKGTLGYLRIPVVFSKTFVKKGRRFAPTFGLGIVAQRPVFQMLTYEFTDDIGSEYYKHKTFRNGIFSIANPYVSLGVSTTWQGKYQLTLRGFYQQNETENLETLVPKHYFGLRLGIGRQVF